MTSIPFDELMERAAAFEQKIESQYAEISEKTEDVGVKLLAFYLSKHRRHLEQAEKAETPVQLSHMESVRLKFDVLFDAERDFVPIPTRPEQVKSRELLDAAVGYDGHLVQLYKSILNQPVGEEAQTFLESLIKLEEKDIVMLKKIVAMDYF